MKFKLLSVRYRYLTNTEPFDRGFFAGPFGWITGSAAEFAVAIRSALIHPNIEDSMQKVFRTKVSLYAGVGIVPESKPESEWQELQLKICPLATVFGGPTVYWQRLAKEQDLENFQQFTASSMLNVGNAWWLPWTKLPNINAAWSAMMVEEPLQTGRQYILYSSR